MAKLTEILDMERKRPLPEHYSQIRLWADGSFYRAYEFSAWLCCRYIRQFKVTRRTIKAANSDLLFIGFPQSSLEKFKPEGATVALFDDKDILLTLPEGMVVPSEDSTLEQEFQNWRTTIPLTESKSEQQEGGKASKLPSKLSSSSPMSMTGIMKSIMEFPVESNTPIDCMLFLADIKKHLSSLL